MGKYITRRFFEMIITLFLIGTATFFLLGAIPGTAIDKKIQKLPEATKQVVIEKYGYDKPIVERYFITLKNYFCGEKVELNGSFYWENKRVTPKLAKNLKRKWLLGMIDYTDIEHILFDNLSILENLCYPLCQKKRGFFLKKKYGELVKEYVNTISPDITLDKKTKELSLEQIMYLAVCRWMICKPQVLIIFIPVFLIKPQTDYVMERILIELKKYGIPVLIVSEQYRYESRLIDNQILIKKKGMWKNSIEFFHIPILCKTKIKSEVAESKGGYNNERRTKTLKHNEPWILQRADPYVYRHTDGNYSFTASVPAYRSGS